MRPWDRRRTKTKYIHKKHGLWLITIYQYQFVSYDKSVDVFVHLHCTHKKLIGTLGVGYMRALCTIFATFLVNLKVSLKFTGLFQRYMEFSSINFRETL